MPKSKRRLSCELEMDQNELDGTGVLGGRREHDELHVFSVFVSKSFIGLYSPMPSPPVPPDGQDNHVTQRNTSSTAQL